MTAKQVCTGTFEDSVIYDALPTMPALTDADELIRAAAEEQRRE